MKKVLLFLLLLTSCASVPRNRVYSCSLYQPGRPAYLTIRGKFDSGKSALEYSSAFYKRIKEMGLAPSPMNIHCKPDQE